MSRTSRRGRKPAPQAKGARDETRQAAPPARPRPFTARALLPYAIIAVLGFAVFANSLRNGFVYDDIPIIRDNPRLDAPMDLPAFFGTSYWGEKQPGTRIYRPLTIWSFALDRAVLGGGPAGVHFVNVVANIVVALLMYLFLLRLLGRSDVALLAAALFVVHPIHSEVVANGVGRAELVSAIFVLAACILHLAHVRGWDAAPADRRTRAPHARQRAWAYLGIALLLYWLGLLSKENAVTLPALLFIMEWTLMRDGSIRRTLPGVWRYALYAAPLALYLAIRVNVVGVEAPMPQEVAYGASAPVRMLHASGVMLRYLGQLIFPVWMIADYSDYDNPVSAATRDPIAIASVFVWIAVAGGIYWLVRRRQWVPLFGIAWFFIALLPTANLLFPIGTIRGDRLLYLPSIGFCLLVAHYMCAVKLPVRRYAYAVAAIYIAALSARTVQSNAKWESTETLWPVTVRHNPGSAVGWTFMGDIHRDRNEPEKALAAYERAMALRENLGGFYPEAANGAAAMLSRQGKRAEAEAMFRRVLAKNPENYVALLNLGELLLHDEARLEESASLLRRASQANPADFRAPANLTQVLLLRKDPAGALEAANAAIAINGAEPMLWELKARALDQLDRSTEAQHSRARKAHLEQGLSVK
jgi:protein O-mannosyl-transferase